ncbi:MAG: hypothetical protein Q8M16_14520 [Pirellulaceae bacterium]|nr:hypothetical protein [Pirellulaceae bacterium]
MNSTSPIPSPSEPPPLLKLTAFERFQYWETRPGFPNQIVAVLDFTGPLDATLFVEAVARVLPRHPLLYSRIKSVGHEPVAFVWSEGRPNLEAIAAPANSARNTVTNPLDRLDALGLQDYVRMQPQPEGWQPQQLANLPDVQPEHGPAFCLTIQFNRTHSRWIMQTHHVVCDGLGGLQSIRELLQVYHWLSSDPQKPFPLRPLQMERLRNRGRLMRGATTLWGRLARLPMKWMGLFGASKFLWRRPVSLSAGNHVHRSASSGNGSPETMTISPEIAWVDGRLTVSQTKRLRQIAKESGVTLNSLLLAHWLTTLHRFRCQNDSSSEGARDCYRLMIPTNERSGGDVALSACNQVSMVYVDRWPREMEHVEGLAAGIDFEMSVIRRWGLSGTFLLALEVLGWLPGLIRWHARRPSGWATSYVTNLGPIMDRLRVGQAGLLSQVGPLTLTEIRMLPPLRPALPAALAVHFYGGQFCLTLHHDPREIPAEKAAELIRMLLNRLRTQ